MTDDIMYDRMLAEQLYLAGSTPKLRELSKKGKALAHTYNHLPYENQEGRDKILKELFQVKGRIYMEPPLYVDYGCHTTIGDDFFANFGCTLLDVAPIQIGNRVMFGPHVSLLTAGHPLDPDIRTAGVEFGQAITIGDKVWLGGNVTVNPGVTIGSNTIIGSGSVVTKDIPANVIAVGNPCKVLRPLTEADKAYWTKAYQAFLKETEGLKLKAEDETK